MGHPFLEQVAAGNRVWFQQLRCVADVEVARQQQHCRAGMASPDLQCGSNAFVGVCWGHLDVDESDVRALCGNHGQQGNGVAGLTDDLDALCRQQLGQAGAQQRHVFGDHDPHGAAPSRMTPSALGVMVSRPPAATNRSSLWISR